MFYSRSAHFDRRATLEDEFGDVEIDLRAKLVTVTTEPIILEGVHLGSFGIVLSWTELAGESGSNAFKIIAREENTASANDAVSHPHVNHQKLCAGDAT